MRPRIARGAAMRGHVQSDGPKSPIASARNNGMVQSKVATRADAG